jgi:hypothetical protein
MRAEHLIAEAQAAARIQAWARGAKVRTHGGGLRAEVKGAAML